MGVSLFKSNTAKKSTKTQHSIQESRSTNSKEAQNRKTYDKFLHQLNKRKLSIKALKYAVNKEKFSLRTTDNDGNTILHHLIKSKKKYNDIIKYILKTDKSLSNFQNKKNETPLHLLLQSRCKNKLAISKLFIANGADISIQNKDGNNFLHLIASLNEEEKVKYLTVVLKATNKSNKILSKSANAKNKKNRTPIQVAIITQGNKVQSEKKSFLQKLRTDKSYLKSKTQHTVDFCVKLLLATAQQNKKVHLNLPVGYKHKTSCYIVTEVHKRTSVTYTKKNSDFKTTLLFIGLISATVFSAISGHMTIAACLSVSIAVCAACYLISSAVTSLINSYSNKSQDINQSTESKSESLGKKDTPSTLLSYISPMSFIKGACI